MAAARSVWKGFIQFSLVSVPVKAYTASVSGGGKIQLNQLHAECNSRIKYAKSCPVHGEVPADQIVSGYEFAKGQYVIVDPEEIEKLRSDGDKSIRVDPVVSADAVDPVYHSGRTYYLVPDGPVGQKPYALIRQSMADEGLHAVGQVVISSKEQLVLVRPIEELLAMTVLQYDSEVKKPVAFKDELVETGGSEEELKLTRTLIGAMKRKKFDIASYRDVYTEKLTQIIEAKVEGKELVAAPAVEEPQIINLMDALKESVRRAKPEGEAEAPAATKKPPRKVAASTRKRAAKAKTTRKRKSG